MIKLKYLIETTTRSKYTSDSDVKRMMTFPNGYYINELLSMRARSENGDLMQNCLQWSYGDGMSRNTLNNLDIEDDENYMDISQSDYANNRFFTLNDKIGKPHATIMIDQRFNLHDVVGKQDAPVIKKYTPYLIKFLKEFYQQIAKEKNDPQIFFKNMERLKDSLNDSQI